MISLPSMVEETKLNTYYEIMSGTAFTWHQGVNVTTEKGNRGCAYPNFKL